MATLKELRDVRLEKLNKLKELGVDPYPARTEKDHDVGEVLADFKKLSGEKVVTAGRVVSVRRHGKLVFIDVADSSGQIQLYIKNDGLVEPNYSNSELSFDDLELLDMGDYVEAKGVVTETKSGEKSIEVSRIRILTKALRPLPDKWDGLKDKETRMRRRYIDTKINDEVYERFVRRAKFWQAHRDFFNERGFLEINIPVLENIPGGADANPFITHMDAIDQDFYLRISQELYLKRLIGGGYEKVYEIGPRFRNEGLSDEHLPEHMAMEFYWAYASWEEGMQMIKELYDHVLEKVYDGKKQFKIRGFDVDFSKDWEVIDFAKVMKERFDIDVHNTSVEEVVEACKKHNVKIDFDMNVGRGIDNLWKKIRKDVVGPAFLINHPKYLSPLSKAKAEEPHVTERCQPIIAGSELGNGWSEINDPQDQLARFREQQNLRDAGDAEAQWLDIDYVEMLEYGMPPTFGWGHSERVFWFLEDVTAREGVPFPQLRHMLDESTKEIYGLKDSEPASLDEDFGEVSGLPTREEALKILEEKVGDEYQRLHAKMVAAGLESYAKELGEDEELWYITGLLHDLDYFEYPEDHPKVSLGWFEEWRYPQHLIHAVAAHAHERTGTKPKTKLAAALIAVDELAGFLYAYSLMRPEGFEGMKTKSVKKKFKDKSFVAKVDRDEILYGMDLLGVDFDTHSQFLIEIYKTFDDLK